MTVEEILEYCHTKRAVEETFPFDKETLVLKVGGKMFLLIPLENQPLTIAVKTDPEWSEELRAKHPQISGAYHMNKTHWNSVVCEGLRKELILKLIDQSYELIFNSLTKKKREEVSSS
ncbi:MmcQ/YjbR family DNA-binding protein [Chryseobacterium sp.]|uniref:MmcQ/YjbR family DNA-binding protein n=1 Tax=Chryseobacterium sp. TaxID=1871047 RepID=UPI0011C7092D|nr:MmcQ/YjbR family DNA-binding protein [Chryseobacterium sp.]TXF79391.1 MmcQ/YjbR family DNA-binding protein [Chryseobacterium sp.]